MLSLRSDQTVDQPDVMCDRPLRVLLVTVDDPPQERSRLKVPSNSDAAPDFLSKHFVHVSAR